MEYSSIKWLVRHTTRLAIAVDSSRASDGSTVNILEVDDFPLSVPVIKVSRCRELAIELQGAATAASKGELAVDMISLATRDDDDAAGTSVDSGLDGRDIVHSGRAARLRSASRSSWV